MLTDQNAHLFITRHVNDYFPCTANSEKLCGFIESQLGMPIVDWPYLLQLEQYEVAFEHIMATSWLYQRPEEVIEEDLAVTREKLAQQKVRDDFDARQRAAQYFQFLEHLSPSLALGDRAGRGVAHGAARYRRVST